MPIVNFLITYIAEIMKFFRQALCAMTSVFCIYSIASITNPCKDEPSENARLVCQDKFELDATKCEKITNLDLKQHCILNVRERQRSVTWTLSSNKPSES